MIIFYNMILSYKTLKLILIKVRKNYFQSGSLWRYTKNVGDAYKGAVTHPGAKTETHTFSEI